MILDPREAPYVAQFIALARSFPSVRSAPGAWGDGTALNMHALDAWATMFAGDGGRQAVAFLLNLWSSAHPWKVGKHDLRRAWASWDVDHKYAWHAWALSPWWP